jgi:two-component system, LuxR family, response regulator FixJ
MTAAPTIYIIEDDPGMRDALTLLLQGDGFDVRAYPSAEAFLAELDRLQPICLITDLRLPDMDGLTLYRHLVKLGLNPATVIITAYGDVPMAVAALKEGVLDFVEKPFDPVLLLECVREAWQHAAASQERKLQVAEIEARRSTLTPREVQVLELLVEAYPNTEIAAKLGTSVRTVEHHRAHIFAKMGARSLGHLIKLVLAKRQPGPNQ